MNESSVRNHLAKMNNKQAVLLKNSDVLNKDIRKLNNAGEKFLTESGVYKLIFKSNKREAERFQDWVTDEVLPQIRKTGSYSNDKSKFDNSLKEKEIEARYNNSLVRKANALLKICNNPNLSKEYVQVLFEIYSTGMALGYVKRDIKTSVQGVPKTYERPFKSRIDKVLENADIKPYVHSGQRYLTEEQLYDFMLEARTEKCKSFRKWVTNVVLPTIRKTGGYVDNADKFTDNYFSNLSLEVRKAIKQELVNRNKVLVNRKRELIVEAEELKREYELNKKTIEQLNI
ncbi:BRO family protein [uncultured Clostridium sp.]|uniref:BRO-N domain-containing protein n=1 Tax=uncultured Clostridium sp. TaxID=59620 RepID=UPI0025EB90D1|nr:BRO family protein [uncultured Clostridium sp.]